ncbi:M20 metallopeptidase family protein [Marinisporobacter balticus]|uniref:Amidohydrolase n=1 Tax=Marinisporobacter balticus TaxID=2018667 RepID=A0A4R2KGH0_9FIRM|nr:amidohydrolase [Marinisporobacter balticus]TCO69068.1 amidohydrolase [Marinisporobacter balticus]
MLTKQIKKLSEKYFDEMKALRHSFHMHPELAFEEFETSKIVAKELKALGIEVKEHIAKTGVVGLIRGKHPGKTVLLRADMDALPIEEEAEVSYKSNIPGRMHACGHDGHTAGLLGVAMILNDLREQIHGNVKLVFQPAEEDDGGAKPMIEEGILENPKVDAAFACHLWGSIKSGDIHVKYGPMMAAPDKFAFKVIGKGGHAAMPHACVDPVMIAVQAINNMQSIVSRRMNPVEPAVVSFCTIHGGKGHNVIPNEVEVGGTIRTFDNDIRKWIPQAMEETLKGITVSQGATYAFELIEHFPPLINDTKMTDLVKTATEKIVGKNHVHEDQVPNMGGEDFSFFAQAVPSAFFFVGIAEDENNWVFHHHPKFQWDDKNLLVSSQALAQVAIDFLNQNN